MSVMFRSLNMFDSSVSALFSIWCQKNSARRGVPMKREPNVTSAMPSTIGWMTRGDVLRVVLEVGVLDDDDVAGRRREPGAQRRALAHVLRLQEHLHLVVRRAARLSFGQPARRGPARAARSSSSRLPSVEHVVDEHQLLVEVDGRDARHDLAQRRQLVVDRE